MEILSLVMLFVFLFFVLFVFLRDARRKVRLVTERVGALERQVTDTSQRLQASERKVARLSGLVTAPSAATETVASPPPKDREPTRQEPSTPPEPTDTLATPSAPPAPATFKPAPKPERTPESRSAVPAWVEAARSWLFGGNTVVRVGVVTLFFGAAYLLNYAAERGWFPVELRLSGAALAGLGLLAMGWILRESRREYALALQGGGIGIVYLTSFAAVNVYELIGAGVGLGVMVGLVACGALLAVTQNSRGLAVLASLGGFLGPVLVSSDASHVALFSYYAALDAGIVAVAWFRAWRGLNLLGFVFTFIVGAMWGFEYYQPQYFDSTQPFLALFFVFFVAVSVLFASHRPPRLKGIVDGTLVFGVPLAAFTLQHRLSGGFEFGPAYSALALSVFYAVVAVAIRWRGRESMQLLTESFVALAVVFGTLMIPLAVDGQWTSAAWALEGAALVWVGARQHRSFAVMSGLALQLLAGTILSQEPGQPAGDVAVLNIQYLGGAMVSLSALFSAWILYRHRDQPAGYLQLSVAALGWGMLWWLGAGVGEISRQLSGLNQQSATLGFVAATFTTAAFLSRRLDWKHLTYPPFLLMPVMVVMTITWLLTASHPLEQWGALAWPAAFLAQFWILWRLDEDWKSEAPVYHCGTLWVGVFLMSWEGAWLVEQLVPEGPSWPFPMWALVPLAVLLGLTKVGTRMEWPLKRHWESYLGGGQLPLAVAVAGWVLVANVHRGDPYPLGYVPFLNPVELVQVLSLGALFWWSSASAFSVTGSERATGIGLLAFATLNGVIARATHYLQGVPFRGPDLWSSAVFQTSLSIVWTVVAFIIMFWATRLKLRNHWWVGGALLAAVVTKLFLVDLEGIGTVARIVSFVVVGGLIIVIGYVSPLPPKEQARPPE